MLGKIENLAINGRLLVGEGIGHHRVLVWAPEVPNGIDIGKVGIDRRLAMKGDVVIVLGRLYLITIDAHRLITMAIRLRCIPTRRLIVIILLILLLLLLLNIPHTMYIILHMNITINILLIRLHRGIIYHHKNGIRLRRGVIHHPLTSIVLLILLLLLLLTQATINSILIMLQHQDTGDMTHQHNPRMNKASLLLIPTPCYNKYLLILRHPLLLMSPCRVVDIHNHKEEYNTHRAVCMIHDT